MSNITIRNSITDQTERKQRFTKLNRVLDSISVGKDSLFLKQIFGFVMRSQKRAGITEDYIDKNLSR
jgi:hypothetical protein